MEVFVPKLLPFSRVSEIDWKNLFSKIRKFEDSKGLAKNFVPMDVYKDDFFNLFWILKILNFENSFFQSISETLENGNNLGTKFPIDSKEKCYDPSPHLKYVTNIQFVTIFLFNTGKNRK